MAEAAWSLWFLRLTGDGGRRITRQLECAIKLRGSTLRHAQPAGDAAA